MAAQEEIQLWQTVAPVEFAPRMSDRTQAQSLLILTRQGAGYQVIGGQLAHAIQARATHLLLDFSANACAIRYQIDGNWEQLPPIDAETANAMLYALKQLCLMNPADRRSAQSGACGVKIAKEKFTLHVQSQGVKTGERVLCRIEAEKIPFDRMSDLGMRDKLYEIYKEKLDAHGNMMLITAPKGEGLTTTWNMSLNAADRLVRDFQSFEDETNPEPEIINVTQNFFGGETGKTELEVVRRMILREPDVLLFPELPEPESLSVCVDQVKASEKQVYLRINATSAIEGFVKIVGRYKELASDISATMGAVLCQKLVRRLCDNCKLGYEPPAQLLKQLGIPPGRVAMLYGPFIPPPIEQQVDENGKPAPLTPCHVCNGRGYYGRIAIFELLTPGEQLRKAVMKTQDVSRLTQIAKAEGHRGLQAEAILTVARGLTSLDELKRVFAKR
ncbi:Type II secretion system protein E [Rubripirellula lacrimiformis]|uniref:Type II secretion system protein E n=1 Tax=Rubripirellula lacrimiformis TaxID=1930273 RepID=A0A517NER6_9BACT|nr:ATPase, T2SS/T4P/T4SS family [Rubripirellula lacrimiformis]QDT05619.1 Type II secretion system protein E [Rubripirellula lacrimiformis]